MYASQPPPDHKQDLSSGKSEEKTGSATADAEAIALQGRSEPHMSQRLSKTWLPLPLIVTSLATGLLDVATFADFYSFASNQTGNCITIFTSALHQTPMASSLLSGISLASFCAFAFVFGQLSHKIRNGPRTRWWLFACGLLQTVLVLVAAILIQTQTWDVQCNEADAARILVLLAGSGGVQVVNAKLSAVPEIPTAVVTSPWVELLSDPHILSPHLLTKSVRSRNLRALHIGGLMAGAALGAVIRKFAGSGPVIFAATGIKFFSTASYLVIPGDA